MSLTLTDREIKALVEKELDRAPQYAFERKVFCDTFYEIFGEDFSVFDLFDYGNITYESFILWNDKDTWYIYSKQFRVAVSWYKHLGRINQCNNEFLDEIGLQTFFLLLREEYYKNKAKMRLEFKLTISEGADYYPDYFYFDAETVEQGVQKMKDFLVEKQADPSDSTDWRFATTKVTISKKGVGSFTYDDINSSFSQILEEFLVAVKENCK